MATRRSVLPPVNVERPSTQVSAKKATSRFCFGSFRYASTGPRRLFVSRKSANTPAYDAPVQQPHSLLRLLSSLSW